MTDPIVLAFLAAVPPTIAAVAGVIISYINSKKADAIHVLVNSNLTEVKENLAEAKLEIKTLRDLVISQRQTINSKV